MNFTSKSRYALKIMIDLAESASSELVQRLDIVQRQGIPLKYLDQIMIRLRQKNLVASSRGRNGGYLLGKSMEAISVWEIFTAVEDSVLPVSCLEDPSQNGCAKASDCATRLPWHLIYTALQRALSEITLEQLLTASQELNTSSRLVPSTRIAGGLCLAQQIVCSASRGTNNHENDFIKPRRGHAAPSTTTARGRQYEDISSDP